MTARGDTAGGLGGGAPGACEAGRSTLRLPGWTPRRLVATVAGGPRWQGAAGGAAASLCPRASHRPARLSPQVLLSGLIGVVSWKRPLSLVVSGARTRGGRGAGPRPRRCERPRGTPRAVGFLAGGAQTFPEGRVLAAEACRLWALHTPLVPSRA